MRLAAAVAAALMALAAAAAAAGGGAAGGEQTLAIPGSIESVTAEHGLVGVHVHPSHGCDYAEFWQLLVPLVSRVQDCSSSDAVLQDLALAGGVPIWWDWSSGNQVYCDDVYTASGGKPRPLGLCDGTMGNQYFSFAGDSSLRAISDYTLCEADCTGANGNLLPDGEYGTEVRLLRGGKLTTVLAPRDFRRFIDARDWHLAVIEPKATLTVYDSHGTKLWSRPHVTGVRGGWIVGSGVVLAQGRSIRLYSRAGAGPARALPAGAHVDDAVGGLVVYRVGSAVRLLRLANGRDRELVTVKGLVQAQITPAGVFYAADSSLIFVPIATALQILR
jgi:hypothetical protein